MGRRGPRPEPTALKILRGVRADRINGSEPIPPAGTPDPPDWLTLEAQATWDELAPTLAGMGVLTLADRLAFAMLCTSAVRWRTEATVRAEFDQFFRLLREFGLTPASRAALRLPAVPSRDELAGSLAHRDGLRGA